LAFPGASWYTAAVHRRDRLQKGNDNDHEHEERKDFDKEAAQWDANPGRVKLANEVADAVIREAKPAKDQDVLDFGCGTGLVTLRLQPLVRSIIGMDSSRGMLAALQDKVKRGGLTNIRTSFMDLEKGGSIEGRFISS